MYTGQGRKAGKRHGEGRGGTEDGRKGKKGDTIKKKRRNGGKKRGREEFGKKRDKIGEKGEERDGEEREKARGEGRVGWKEGNRVVGSSRIN